MYGVVINRHHVEIMRSGMKVNMKNYPSPFRGLALVKIKGSCMHEYTSAKCKLMAFEEPFKTSLRSKKR